MFSLKLSEKHLRFSYDFKGNRNKLIRLRILWRLSVILKKATKVYEEMFFENVLFFLSRAEAHGRTYSRLCCVWLSNDTSFWENYEKLYFDAKHLKKGLQLGRAALLKKRLTHRCFPVNFMKFLRTLSLIEHLWWLLLTFNIKLVQTNSLIYVFPEIIRKTPPVALWFQGE